MITLTEEATRAVSRFIRSEKGAVCLRLRLTVVGVLARAPKCNARSAMGALYRTHDLLP